MSLLKTVQFLLAHPNPPAMETLRAGLASKHMPTLSVLVKQILLEREPQAWQALLDYYPTFAKSVRRVAAEVLTQSPRTQLEDFFMFLRKTISQGKKHQRLTAVAIIREAEVYGKSHLLVSALEYADTRSSAESALLHFTETFVRSAEDLDLSDPHPHIQKLLHRKKLLLDALYTGLANFRQHRSEAVPAALLMLDTQAHETLFEILENPSDLRRADFFDIFQKTTLAPMTGLLVRLVTHPSPELRDQAKRIFAGREDLAFHHAVAQALSQMDGQDRYDMASAFTEVPWWKEDDKIMGEALLLETVDLLPHLRLDGVHMETYKKTMMHAPFVSVRSAILYMLAKTGDPLFSIEARRILKKGKPTDLHLLVEVFHKVDHGPYKDMLHALVDQDDLDLSRKALDIIEEDNFRGYYQNYQQVKKFMTTQSPGLSAKVDEEFLDRLKEELGAPAANRKLQALQLLGIVEDLTPLMKHLLKLTQDPEKRIRATLVNALARSKSIAATKILITMLTDEDHRVKANAIEALEELGHDFSMKLLEPFFHHPNNRIRANTIKALWNLGHPQATAHLRDMLAHPNDMMRVSALWALREVDLPDRSDLANGFSLNDASPEVRRQARILLDYLAEGYSLEDEEQTPS